jgi:hypothetical protein
MGRRPFRSEVWLSEFGWRESLRWVGGDWLGGNRVGVNERYTRPDDRGVKDLEGFEGLELVAMSNSISMSWLG